MTRFTSHGIEHYHQAALALLEEKGGSFRLDGTKTIYREFHSKIHSLLRADDYEPFSSVPEPRWETRFRWALKHMRDDGRVSWHGHGQYEITDSGRQYLRTTLLPLEMMTEEVEVLNNGEMRIRYLFPDGSVHVEFGCRVDADLDELDFGA